MKVGNAAFPGHSHTTSCTTDVELPRGVHRRANDGITVEQLLRGWLGGTEVEDFLQIF